MHYLMPLANAMWDEPDTHSNLIDSAIHALGWIKKHIKREEFTGTIEIANSKPRSGISVGC